MERLLLADMACLVTHRGRGIGKSRLALAEVTARVAAEFADGIGYVDVSNETVPDRVFTRSPSSGVAGDPSHPALDALIDHVADLDVSLVLDGLERVCGCDRPR